ncbi:MAG TPA: tetratricopeptide repeat protein [Thermoanaerobaculia bacterium]|nr:tetratricopeptide repeat protein [Thermoanaerobaculia bacterium]
MIRSRFLPGIAVLFAVCAAAAAAGAPAPKPAPAAPSAAPVVEQVPNTPGKATWERTYTQAQERAVRESKVVFVEFTETGCGNCARMDALLYPAANFEMMLLRMVPVKLDRTSPEAAPIAERYGITESPAALIVSPGGALVFRVNGFDNAGDFYRHVQQSMTEWDKLHVKMIHEPEFQDDPKEELALGTALALRFDPEEAAPRFARAAASKTADPDTRDAARTYLASAQFKMKRFEEARATIAALLETSRNPSIREQGELFRGEIAIAEGRREEARRTIVAFLRDHPESPLRGNAERMLTSIPAGEPARP